MWIVDYRWMSGDIWYIAIKLNECGEVVERHPDHFPCKTQAIKCTVCLNEGKIWMG